MTADRAEVSRGVRRPRLVSRPELPPGPVADLNAFLHDLYLSAATPTLDALTAAIAADDDLAGAPGRDTIRRCLSSTAPPANSANLVAVVTVLARAAGRDVDAAVGEAEELWRKARGERPDPVSDPRTVARAKLRYGTTPVVPTYFTGREDALRKLRRRPDDHGSITAVCGIGGVGKTQVAARFYREVDRDGDVPVMAWLDAQSGLSEQLTRLAVAFGVVEWANEDDTLAALMRWLHELAEPWLIVADNVEDPSALGLLRSVAGNGRLIVTSRYPDWGDFGPSIELRPFDVNHGASLLRSVAERPHDPGADVLNEHLGGLPLALVLAATLCRERRQPFADYRSSLLERGLTPLLGVIDPASNATISAVWTASLAAATRRSASAAVLLATLAHLDWRRISRDWLASGLAGHPTFGDRDVLDAALAALRAYNLVSLNDDALAVTHGIIADGVIVDLVHSSGPERSPVEECLTALLERTLREPGHDALIIRQSTEALHHLYTMVTTNRPLPPSFTTILDRATQQLHGQQDRGRCETVATANLRFNQTTKGADHEDTIVARRNLAISRRDVGATDEAIVMLESLAEDAHRVFGDHHPEPLLIRGHLALAYRDVARTSDAIATFEQVVAASRRVVGDHHNLTIQGRIYLGLSYSQMGRTATAVRLLERVEADLRRDRGDHDPYRMLARAFLGVGCRDNGRVAEAVEILEDAVAFAEQFLGAHNTYTLRAKAQLALGWIVAGHPDEALPILERVSEEAERTLGPSDRDTLRFAAYLGFGQARAGLMADAVGVLTRTASDAERILGRRHPHTLRVRSMLATVILESGRAAESIPLLERVAADIERSLGDRYPHALRVRAVLAAAYSRAQRRTDAVDTRNRVSLALDLFEPTARILAEIHTLLDSF
jgi:tetratricopeptide (TPR) repeat protein